MINNSAICIKNSEQDYQAVLKWFKNYYHPLQTATDISAFVAPAVLNSIGQKIVDTKVNELMSQTYENSKRKQGVYGAKAIREDIIQNQKPALQQAIKAQNSNILSRLSSGLAIAGAAYEMRNSLSPETTTKDFVISSVKAVGILGVAALATATSMAALPAVILGLGTAAILDTILSSEEFDNLLGDIGDQKLGDTYQYLTNGLLDDLNEAFNNLINEKINNDYDNITENIDNLLDKDPSNQCSKFTPYEWR